MKISEFWHIFRFAILNLLVLRTGMRVFQLLLARGREWVTGWKSWFTLHARSEHLEVVYGESEKMSESLDPQDSGTVFRFAIHHFYISASNWHTKCMYWFLPTKKSWWLTYAIWEHLEEIFHFECSKLARKVPPPPLLARHSEDLCVTIRYVHLHTEIKPKSRPAIAWWCLFKGTVQWKLRWVKRGVNR